MSTADYIPCTMTDTIEDRVVVSFNVFDGRGRLIGAHITRGRLTITRDKPRAESDYRGRHCRPDELGDWFTFTPHATRDAHGYGACQSQQQFRTELERETAIGKYLQAAERRAKKHTAAVAAKQARREPYCKVCGESHSPACVDDDLPEPGEMRETGR